MSEALYTRAVLRLTTDDTNRTRLTAPHVTVEKRSATCGSRIVVDLCVDHTGRVSAYGYAASACALGQASAVLVARHIVARSGDELKASRRALVDYLDGRTATPGDWPGLDAIMAVRGYPARHGAVLLPFDAAVTAIDRVDSAMAA